MASVFAPNGELGRPPDARESFGYVQALFGKPWSERESHAPTLSSSGPGTSVAVPSLGS